MPLKWWEIFRAGTRTSSNGVTRDYTSAELDQVVETYDPVKFKAPLIVSYPAHNTGSYSDSDLHKSQLAFGYPEQLRRDGDKLLAGFEKISPKVSKWIREGAILGFSSSFYLPDSAHNPYPGNLALRHVAGCGVDPPAIKGMDLPDDFTQPTAEFENYSEDQADTADFGLNLDGADLEDTRLGLKVWNAFRNVANTTSADFMAMGGHDSPVASLFKDFYQRTRDRFIEEKGLEEADKAYPAYVLDQLTTIVSQPTPLFATWDDLREIQYQIDRLRMPSSAESDNLEGFSEEESFMTTEAEFEELKEQVNDATTKIKLLTQENERLAQENRAIAHQRENDRITAFCEGLVRERKLLPVDKDREIRFILNLDNAQSADYGEEEGTITPRAAYLNKLARGRELWSSKQLPIGPEDAPSFSEKVPDGYDAKSSAQHRQVQVYANEHSVSFNEALDALTKTGALK